MKLIQNGKYLEDTCWSLPFWILFRGWRSDIIHLCVFVLYGHLWLLEPLTLLESLLIIVAQLSFVCSPYLSEAYDTILTQSVKKSQYSELLLRSGDATHRCNAPRRSNYIIHFPYYRSILSRASQCCWEVLHWLVLRAITFFCLVHPLWNIQLN